jgi:soluble lytic murein transglycosylase-like protein
MTQPRRAARLLQASSSIAVIALLAACSSQVANKSAQRETARYVAHAKGNYVPPGSADDPWGPYIHEASARFDVPELWIRSVMRVESGGNAYRNGQVITSNAGAMGLMQVMPATYDDLRGRYSLGDDPFNPHDNILAGAAYMRQMYDIYGSPGFLAAYNAGPARLDDYLTNNRALPDETRHYVAAIGANIVGTYPTNRSPAEQYAMNNLPVYIQPGPRYGRSVQMASQGGNGRAPASAPVQVAQLPEPPRAVAPPQQQVAMLVTPPPPPPPMASRHGFQFIPSANAAEAAPMRHGGVNPGQWAIQVGAFASQGQAQAAVGSARERAQLAVAHPYVESVQQPRGRLWRARLTGLSRETAMQACDKLSHTHGNCIVLSPEAQL